MVFKPKTKENLKWIYNANTMYSYKEGFWKHFLPIYETSEIWCSIIVPQKKKHRNFFEPSNSEQKIFLGGWGTIGLFGSYIPNFHTLSSFFAIRAFSVILNLQNRRTSFPCKNMPWRYNFLFFMENFFQS